MSEEEAYAASIGLSSAEVEYRTKQGKTNAVEDSGTDSVAAIVVRNVFTYFNGIFALLVVLLIVAGAYKSLTFLPVIIANTIIGIVQQLRAKKTLDDLALINAASYETFRDGDLVMVNSDDLVLGDICRFEAGQQIPADARVLAGEGSANESLLTGEQDEVVKTKGSKLLSGSFLVSGWVTAELTKVGKDSYAQTLSAEAKATKVIQSEMVASIERIIQVAGVLIIPVGALMYSNSVYRAGMGFSEAISSMVAAVIGMIPEGLYLLVTVALALSAMRLAKQWVLLHDMRSIESLARVDVICVDKTGTITTDRMRVVEVFFSGQVDEKTREDTKDLLASYVMTVSDNNATFQALRECFGDADPLAGVSVTPFSSVLKYSEVQKDGRILRLGAPEFVLGDIVFETVRPLIERYSSRGMRVLVFADCTEERPKPLLFVALVNEIRPDATETFDYLQDQGVKVMVISGDSPLTVSKVAKAAHVANADAYCDASRIQTHEEMLEAVDKYVVFGRVRPEQKRELVRVLHEKGHKVAMTGDGVNDILAMREAECSIAMGSGSDAARQAAQVVLLDSDFSHMRQIIGEGRRDINNITRSATLFTYKNIFSLLLALFTVFGAFTYPLSPNQVSLISFFNIGLPAFLLSFEPNEQKQRGHFITEVFLRSLPAALTSFVAIADMIVVADLFGISTTDVSTASTFLLSVVGFLMLISISSPTNRYRAMVLVICLVGFCLGSWLLRDVFDIYNMSMVAWVLFHLFVLSEVGVLFIFTHLVNDARRRLPVYFPDKFGSLKE